MLRTCSICVICALASAMVRQAAPFSWATYALASSFARASTSPPTSRPAPLASAPTARPGCRAWGSGEGCLAGRAAPWRGAENPSIHVANKLNLKTVFNNMRAAVRAAARGVSPAMVLRYPFVPRFGPKLSLMRLRLRVPSGVSSCADTLLGLALGNGRGESWLKSLSRAFWTAGPAATFVCFLTADAASSLALLLPWQAQWKRMERRRSREA